MKYFRNFETVGFHVRYYRFNVEWNEFKRGDTKKERDFEEIVTSVRRNL